MYSGIFNCYIEEEPEKNTDEHIAFSSVSWIGNNKTPSKTFCFLANRKLAERFLLRLAKEKALDAIGA